MTVFWEIIKVLLPSVVVFITAYYLVKMMLSKESKVKELEVSSGAKKDVLFLRLQAYERLILLMERIAPPNLIMRMDRNGLSASDFQLDLLTTIRAEYEHNIAQQLYISQAAWKVVCQAKEELITIINLSVQDTSGGQTAIEYSRILMEMYYSSDQPAQKAIDFLKNEARTLF
jgi:hypothetical protein